MIVKQIRYNRTRRNASDDSVKYIVIHDTGNSSRGANAEMHYKYFNGGNRNSSADYFVDDKGVWKVNDHSLYYSWHCGDGRGKYGVYNSNSVGVEMCINSDSNRSEMLKNTVGLVISLQAQYPNASVIRHYDASRKNCPQTMNNNGDWSAWIAFKNSLKRKIIEEVIQVFKDMDSVSPWAKASVERLESLGIFRGDEKANFNPKESVTRQELAVVMDKLLKLLSK